MQFEVNIDLGISMHFCSVLGLDNSVDGFECMYT
jgi:hypothetical protein